MLISFQYYLGVGADGFCTKVERLEVAIKYVSRNNIMTIEQNVYDRLKAWKESMRKERKTKMYKRMYKNIDEATSEKVAQFLIKGQQYITNMIDNQKCCNALVATYLFVAFTYGNWQRPGGAIHMTVEEAEDFITQDDSIIIKSFDHKTASSQGPVMFCLEGKQVNQNNFINFF